MDCRTARSLINQQELDTARSTRLQAHLASCGACADDQADPVGVLLRHTELPLAHPPPNFTANTIARLPTASPIALQRQAQQRRQNWRGGIAFGLSLAGVGLAFSSARLAQTSSLALLGDTRTELGRFLLRLVLAAKSVLLLATHPVVVALVLAGLLLLFALRNTPRLRGQLALGAASCALALAVIVSVQVSLWSSRSTYSFRAPLTIDGATEGDVLSLFGDITVRGRVRGDVVSLVGQVKLEPRAQVDGSVLAGAGTVETGQAHISGSVVDGLGPLTVLATVNPTANDLSQRNIARLSGIFGALITLALAALWVMVRPHQVRRAARRMLQAPFQALLLGLGATLILGGLLVGGTLVLAATLIGVVVVPLLLLLTHLPFVQGIAAVGQALGKQLTGADRPTGAFWGIAVQVGIVLALALAAPLASLTAFYLFGSLGLGAVLLDLQQRRAA